MVQRQVVTKLGQTLEVSTVDTGLPPLPCESAVFFAAWALWHPSWKWATWDDAQAAHARIVAWCEGLQITHRDGKGQWVMYEPEHD